MRRRACCCRSWWGSWWWGPRRRPSRRRCPKCSSPEHSRCTCRWRAEQRQQVAVSASWAGGAANKLACERLPVRNCGARWAAGDRVFQVVPQPIAVVVGRVYAGREHVAALHGLLLCVRVVVDQLDTATPAGAAGQAMVNYRREARRRQAAAGGGRRRPQAQRRREDKCQGRRAARAPLAWKCGPRDAHLARASIHP